MKGTLTGKNFNFRQPRFHPSSLLPDSCRAPLVADFGLVGHAPDLFGGEASAEALARVGDCVGGRGERGDGRGEVARVYLVGRVGDGVVDWEVWRLVLYQYEVRHALGHEGRVVCGGERVVLNRELAELRERRGERA